MLMCYFYWQNERTHDTHKQRTGTKPFFHPLVDRVLIIAKKLLWVAVRKVNKNRVRLGFIS